MVLTTLTLPQMTNFTLFQTERVCNFKCHENGRKFSKSLENTVGKGENCLLQAISPFSTVFTKDLYCRHVKCRDCLGKGYERSPFENNMNENCKVAIARKVLCCLTLKPPYNRGVSF